MDAHRVMGLRSLFPVAAADVAEVPTSYCHCHLRQQHGKPNDQHTSADTPDTPSGDCRCGEWRRPSLCWTWDRPPHGSHTATDVRISDAGTGTDSGQRVLFHPVYSAGTAVVRSDRPLAAGELNYFEVKVLTRMTGTDVMIGIGTERVCLRPPMHEFASHLGRDDQSWGYSYRGLVQHDGVQRKYGRRRFSIGCIVGVLADLRHGRLEFYLNRRPLGIAYRNIPAGNDAPLYAYATSTAAKSALKLIHASHHVTNLQLLAFRALAATSQPGVRLARSMPGLRHLCAELFYLHTHERYAYDEEAGPGSRGRSLDEEALLSSERADAVQPRPPRGHLDDEWNDDVERSDQPVEEAELDIYADLVTDETSDESTASGSVPLQTAPPLREVPGLIPFEVLWCSAD